ncbi:MAG: YSC84-related protein [Steroidobacteraceae bacterium]|jgi:lipid-binding SYLF domain-containing protein|nr:YSC84-related protein [Steroidobacteraceae bacterium]
MRLLSVLLPGVVACLLLAPPAVHASSRAEIDARVREALAEFRRTTQAGAELSGKSRAMLVFPRVIKGGIGIGAEYGEGALLSGGKTVGYYNIASASVGLQLGVQAKSVVILFMTDDAYQDFRKRKGWKAGVDGSVALATLGAGGELDTDTARRPIIGFVFSNKGLMYNLTLEGSKISKIDPE